jgi:ribosomal protein S12 methylthiotransferase
MTFFIDNHGCAKNQVDAEEISERLEAAGHTYVETADKADLVIVNTCGFIKDAKQESIDAVLELRARHPEVRILVAGCLSQRYAADLDTELTEADGFVGNADLSILPEAAEATLAGQHPVLVPPAPSSSAAVLRRRLFDFPGTAHVKAAEGCSNNCSYCAIPLIRGPLRSRPLDEVASECRTLVERGISELVLIGQDLGSFGRDSASSCSSSLLPDLIRAISRIEGDFRVRILYLHPDNFPEELLDSMAADERILPYFDLPFQHASARILRAMNRRGNAEAYLDLLARIRSVFPEAAIRSTFLIGFPGESEEDFGELRQFQEAAKLDWLGSFAYSREEGTAAYSLKGRVPASLVSARRKAVEEAQERITRERLERFIGMELDVLAEEIFERPEGKPDEEELTIGRAWNQAPEVDGLTVIRGRVEPGTVVRVRVLRLAGVDFDALPLGTAASS